LRSEFGSPRTDDFGGRLPSSPVAVAREPKERSWDKAALVKAESLGGTRVMGPDAVMDQVELSQFADPDGHVIGVVKTLSYEV